MKQLLIATAVALACSAALAQTPASPPNPARPSQVEQGAVHPNPKTTAAAEAKVDARQSANPGADGTTFKRGPVTGEVPAGSRAAAAKGQMNVDARKSGDSNMNLVMDSNGDGMISRREYDTYHASMWKGMKANKGMVPQVDMETRLKQGLGGK